MNSAGLVTALVAWARDDLDKIAELTAERDALIEGFLNGGKPTSALTSASANGKSFTRNIQLPPDDKLALLTNVLVELGVIDRADLPPSCTYGDFSGIAR